ncbi:hypothetical protein QYM36_001042 [Artemia franciscana]|uniref:Uncharacterized protein n=1 Tax=Artemia franciscana TaxID=6661 RepID=A0AA88IC07_ARTSF|nr:hypothetical protein QYM36_001042 [Artemia franciscana]
MEDFAFKSFIESVSNEKFSHRVFRAICGTKFQSDREEKQEYHLFMETINYNEAFAESWYKMLYGAQGSKRSVSEAAELPRRLCKEVSLPEETNADNSATEATSKVAAVPESSNSLGQAKMDADSSSETNTQHLSHCCEAKIDQFDLPKTEDSQISPKFDAFQVCTDESLNKSKPGIEACIPTNVKTKGDILRAPIGSKDSGAKIQTLHNSTCIVHLPAETEKKRDLLKRLTPIGLNNSGQFAVSQENVKNTRKLNVKQRLFNPNFVSMKARAGQNLNNYNYGMTRILRQNHVPIRQWKGQWPYPRMNYNQNELFGQVPIGFVQRPRNQFESRWCIYGPNCYIDGCMYLH